MRKIDNFMLPQNFNETFGNEALSSIALTRLVAEKINELVEAYNNLNTMDLHWKQNVEGKVNAGVVFMKDNIINSIHEIIKTLRYNGDLDSIITSAMVESYNNIVNSFNYTKVKELGGFNEPSIDNTNVFKEALLKPITIDLDSKEWVVSDTLALNHCAIQNGTLVYTGVNSKPIIHMLDNCALKNVKIVIKTTGFKSDVVLMDYTGHDEQWTKTNLLIDGLIIDNTAEENYINSCNGIRIIYDKFKVITEQNVNNVYGYGRFGVGIFVNPQLRNEEDNPVFNSATFSKVFFDSANTLLKTCPTMITGNIENAKGEIILFLNNFCNQNRTGITGAYMDLHNTHIEGVMCIPWDYYGDRIPTVGVYKLHKSYIAFDKDYLTVTNDVEGVYYGYKRLSTGEVYSNIHAVKPKTVNDDLPKRNSGTAWGVDNIKNVIFKPSLDNPYNNEYIGWELQHNNKDMSDNKAVQFGFSSSGSPVVRQYLESVGSWGAISKLYCEGKMPTSYSGKRPDGLGIGDMKFDTTLKKPVWWNGENWVDSTGTTI